MNQPYIHQASGPGLTIAGPPAPAGWCTRVWHITQIPWSPREDQETQGTKRSDPTLDRQKGDGNQYPGGSCQILGTLERKPHTQ